MSRNICDDLFKASAPFALGGSLLVLSSVTLAGTLLGLTVATPMALLFSPVLVPALLTGAAIFIGAMASVGLGASAYWVFTYMTGKKPLGAAEVDCLFWRVKKAFTMLTSVRVKQQNASHSG